VLISSHATGRGEIGDLVRAVWPHLQAVWQSGGGNLIEQIGDRLRLDIHRPDPDPVECWHVHAAHSGECPGFGQRPPIGNTRDKVLPRFKQRRGRNTWVDGH